MRADGIKSSRLKCVIFVTVGIFLFLQTYPFLLEQKTQNHMLKISDGISRYDIQYHRLPSSLKELVDSGFLPEKSQIYKSPLVGKSLLTREVYYTESEFEFTFDTSMVAIRTRNGYTLSKQVFHRKFSNADGRGH